MTKTKKKKKLFWTLSAFNFCLQYCTIFPKNVCSYSSLESRMKKSPPKTRKRVRDPDLDGPLHLAMTSLLQLDDDATQMVQPIADESEEVVGYAPWSGPFPKLPTSPSHWHRFPTTSQDSVETQAAPYVPNAEVSLASSSDPRREEEMAAYERRCPFPDLDGTLVPSVSAFSTRAFEIATTEDSFSRKRKDRKRGRKDEEVDITLLVAHTGRRIPLGAFNLLVPLHAVRSVIEQLTGVEPFNQRLVLSGRELPLPVFQSPTMPPLASASTPRAAPSSKVQRQEVASSSSSLSSRRQTAHPEAFMERHPELEEWMKFSGPTLQEAFFVSAEVRSQVTLLLFTWHRNHLAE